MDIRDIVDIDKMEEIMKAWSTACNMATVCLGAKGEYITGQIGFTDFCTKYTRQTEKGDTRCQYCDRNNEGIYYCHAGLMDFGFDIFLENGEKVGRIIGGQVLSKPIDEDKIIALADDLGIPREEYLEAARKIPIRDEESIKSSAFLLDRVFNYLVNSEYAKLLQEKNITKLDMISKCDSLTGLYNNKYCKEFVAKKVSENKPFAMFIFDLDKFKHINDTYGHMFGDKVLKSFANIIDMQKPKDAVAGRHGGDEFVIIAPISSERQAKCLAAAIQKVIKTISFEEDSDFLLTTSIGISMYPNHGSDVARLYENADLALYAVKKNGGNGYMMYQNTLRSDEAL